MSLAWRTLSMTRITGGASSSVPSARFTVTGMSVFTPPSCSRKSMWKVGAAELAVGDAVQAHVLLELDDLADGA
jgi:hypothetical protein